MQDMRMSHVYQPVMLKVLIEGNGKASLRAIAAAFLAHDQAQLEYYEEITKRMPGRVLQNHGLVEREGDGYRLTLPLGDLTEAQRDELIRICDAKVDDYLRRRGARAYDHRRTALGELSGTVRYQVLSRAGFRCELCGVPADEHALEVDHIIPRRHGGQDDETNLQALCWRCNANKGARDDTDFRAVRAALNARQVGMPSLRHRHWAHHRRERLGGGCTRCLSSHTAAHACHSSPTRNYVVRPFGARAARHKSTARYDAKGDHGS